MKKFTLLVIWTAFSCFAGFAQEDMPARASFRNGKLTFETRDRAFRLWFDNRIYVDAAAYLPSEDVSGLMSKPNKDLEYDDGAFRFSNGMSIRPGSQSRPRFMRNGSASSTSISRTTRWS